MDPVQRKALMIDPGPRSVEQPGERQEFSRYTPPQDYTYFSFPPTSLNPPINSLGEIRMDASGLAGVAGRLRPLCRDGDPEQFPGCERLVG